MSNDSKPVAGPENFDRWWDGNYGAGRNGHHPPYRIANRAWQAALSSQQPVAATGEDAGQFDVLSHEGPVLVALKTMVDLATADDDRSYWSHELNAVSRDLSLLRAAQRTAQADGGMDVKDENAS